MFKITKSCSNCSSFVLMPTKKIKINLEKKIETFEEKKFKINTFTGSLLSLEKKCKINIYSSGKTILKTKDKVLAKKLSKELSNILYPDIQTS